MKKFRPKLFQRFVDDASGGVAIIFAAAAILFVILAALAIDLGSIALRAREVQGTADLAAMAATRDLPRAQDAAMATAKANLGNDITVVTDIGIWEPDPSKKPADRFRVVAANPNGSRVKVTAPARLYFAGIFGKNTINITRTATAAIPGAHPSALFTLGTRLLSLNKGIVNALLSNLLGTNINLSVVDYENLVKADVNLLDFLDALAVELKLEAGNYEQLLGHEVSAGQVLKVLEYVAGGDVSLLKYIGSVPVGPKIKVSELVGVDANARDGLRRGLDVDASALGLLVAALETGNGNRQLSLDTNLNLGVANVRLMAAVGEKPNQSSWVRLSEINGTVLKTAQTRIYASITTVDFLSDLANLKLDAFVEVGSAEAKITDIQCSSTNKVLVDVTPGLLELAVGKVNNPSELKDFKKKITSSKQTIATVLFIPITFYTKVETKDTKPQKLTFNQSDIDQKKYKTVKSKEIATTLLNSLTKNVELDIGLLSLGWVLNLLTPLTTFLGWVLDSLLNPLLSLLGVGLGEADVAVLGVNCPGGRYGVPTLVG